MTTLPKNCKPGDKLRVVARDAETNAEETFTATVLTPMLGAILVQTNDEMGTLGISLVLQSDDPDLVSVEVI